MTCLKVLTLRAKKEVVGGGARAEGEGEGARVGRRGEGALCAQVADAASVSKQRRRPSPSLATSVRRRAKVSGKQPPSAARHLLNCLFQSPPSLVLQEGEQAA